MKFISSVSVALLAALSAASATMVERSAQDHWNPSVVFPSAGAVLNVGDSYTFSWDTKSAPVNITNKVGAVFLRKGDTTTPLILAGSFPITDGKVQVTVPWVSSGSDYSITLFGDSGNFSPEFSITAPDPFKLHA